MMMMVVDASPPLPPTPARSIAYKVRYQTQIKKNMSGGASDVLQNRIFIFSNEWLQIHFKMKEQKKYSFQNERTKKNIHFKMKEQKKIFISK